MKGVDPNLAIFHAPFGDRDRAAPQVVTLEQGLAQVKTLNRVLSSTERPAELIGPLQIGQVIRVGTGLGRPLCIEIDPRAVVLADLVGRMGQSWKDLEQGFDGFVKRALDSDDGPTSGAYWWEEGRREGNALVVPLSTFLDHRIGNCSTVTLSAQLALQGTRDIQTLQVNLINNEGELFPHACNVIRAPNRPLLLADFMRGHFAPVQGVDPGTLRLLPAAPDGSRYQLW